MLNLKKIRKIRNMTQSDVAKELKISTSAYNQLENEKYSMNIKMLEKLCDILNVSADEILGRSQTQTILDELWNKVDELKKR